MHWSSMNTNFIKGHVWVFQGFDANPKALLMKALSVFVSEVSVMAKIAVDNRVSIIVEFLAQEIVEKSPTWYFPPSRVIL